MLFGQRLGAAFVAVFDALISKRVYKNAMMLEETRSIIEQGSGKHFDPDVTAAFVRASNTSSGSRGCTRMPAAYRKAQGIGGSVAQS